MPDVTVDVFGIREIEAAFQAMDGGFQARLLGPALGRMARVVRIQAKQLGYVFRDRRRRLGYPSSLDTGTFRDLRQSIRARRITGIYGGRRYRTGRAAVFGGGSGAAQAHLVEAGHGGPRPARPYPFLLRSLTTTTSQQGSEFQRSLRSRFPRIAAQIAQRRQTFSAAHSFGRTVARRARSR